MWMNLRYTFTSPAQTDSAEWCAEQTVIALGVFSIRMCIYMCTYIVVFELICTLIIIVLAFISHNELTGMKN